MHLRFSTRIHRLRLPCALAHVSYVPDRIVCGRLTFIREVSQVLQHAHRIHLAVSVTILVHAVPRTAADISAVPFLLWTRFIHSRKRNIGVELERHRGEEVVDAAKVPSSIHRTTGERRIHIHLREVLALHALLIAHIVAFLPLSTHAPRTRILAVTQRLGDIRTEDL